MVDGTGLEYQRAKASQVRILSFPPIKTNSRFGLFFINR